MLKVEHIDVFYGDLQVLWDVSFEVNKGEIVVLLGANGAGKSTTLKTISSLLKPERGSISFEGARLDEVPAHQIIEFGIAHVPEGRRLFPEMTVEENLITGALKSEAKIKRNDTMKSGVRTVSQTSGKAKTECGDLIRRRAANASGWPRTDVFAETPHV